MKEIDFSRLKEPFAANDIEWRLQSCGEKNGKIWGICLAYVTNRAIQNRLDEVVGPENWKNEFREGPDGGILCGLSIKCGDEWVTKWDGAENTQIEAVKGGLSGSMKRAASTGWGIGRYLYYLDEGFANISDNGKFNGKTKEGKWFKWDPPKLPAWALPGKTDTAKNIPTPAVSASFNTMESVKDTPELTEAIKTVQNYITMGVFKDSEFRKRAELHINNKDLAALRKVITYAESQINSDINNELKQGA